ncbi:SAF domain-containing protein [Bifidobacterium amazonense]|uniref:SAF domain-containing protein n=1 Tax=Bifidobacterium amazonense TaxID=2809027 RepID=A0ABS9VVW1_9BIFI|nr:SAF domain-containing protein [Bifidobacterium amazonense]MCH9276208.1 SAF domain-containing protein [Bifidobacterium amazonense]
MMTDFFVRGRSGSRSSRANAARGGPRRRRTMRLMRRWLSALCAGLAVFAALSCVLETAETRRILVAASDIARGSSVDGTRLRMIEVPAHAVFDAVVDSTAELDGDAVAQVDIAAGQPLFRSMIGTRPAVPDGHAVVEVRLSSAPDALTAGETIALASAHGCAHADDADGDAADGTADRDGSGQLEPDAVASCTLTSQAIVVALPAGSSVDDPSRTGSANLVSLAMPADDAMRVLTAQESGPVIAVR